MTLRQGLWTWDRGYERGVAALKRLAELKKSFGVILDRVVGFCPGIVGERHVEDLLPVVVLLLSYAQVLIIWHSKLRQLRAVVLVMNRVQ